MDVRRLNSTPLVDVGSEVYGSCAAVRSPHGSPKMHSSRLPALWKSLKAKLGSLSTSRSANNLSSLATVGPDARASPSASPPTQTTALCQNTKLHTQSRPSHCLFLTGSSPDGAFARQATSSLNVNSQQTRAKAIPGNLSPTAICTPTNALSIGPSSSSGSAPSTTTMKPIIVPGPTPLSSSFIPEVARSDALNPTQHQNPRVTMDAAPTENRKLLAVSPALPSSMRRSVWALEDYSISRRIFKGSSSAVYKATCRRSGLPVALKVYFLCRVPINVVHMLKREIEIHTQIVHRNVVRLYAAFMDEGDRVVLVQEYAAQGDLYGVLQRAGGRMPPDQVADGVMRPFLEALSYMHSRGVCHRDIKPENILFTNDWRLLVADFGVSIDLNQERAVTRAGTEGYMAPEVERCPLKADPHDNKDDPRYAYSTAVDIWAVGVLAYELMVGLTPVVMSGTNATDLDAAPASSDNPTGTPTTDDDSMSGFVRSHMSPTSLHFPASVPPVARAFILAALASDPLERPTAAQLLHHPWLQPKVVAVAAAPAAAPATAAEATVQPSSRISRSGGIYSAALHFGDMEGLASRAPVGAGMMAVTVATGQRSMVNSGSPAATALCTAA